MNNGRLLCGLAAMVGACALGAGCGGNSTSSGVSSTPDAGCEPGSERCECYGNGTCDGDLICLSDLCVDPSSGAGGSTAGSGGGSTTGGTAGSGGGVTAGAAGSGGGSTTGGTAGSGGGVTAGAAGGPVVGPGGAAGSGSGTGAVGGFAGAAPGVPPSCAGMSPTACDGDDCCATIELPGGWFAMGAGEGTACAGNPGAGNNCGSPDPNTCLEGTTTWACPTGTWLNLGGDDDPSQLTPPVGGRTDETPEHAVQVSGYNLDKYEVTVGRWRRFVAAYDKAELLSLLDGGAGAHPLVGGSAWQSSWDDRLPETQTALEESLDCDASATWTGSGAANEHYPINCLTWYVAYAFCAWDGGRLPTEAEWEFAAAGGDQNRVYPWGDQAPAANLANYNETDNSTAVDVFAKPDGAGRWGHHGLAGSIWEWTLDVRAEDWYESGGNDCQDCANVGADEARVLRGGDFNYDAASLRAAGRFAGSPGSPWLGHGLRCARD